MTKKEAQKFVQEKLGEAKTALDEAAKVMDEHQFTAMFLENQYMPRGHKYDPDLAADGADPFGVYIEDDDPKAYDKWFAGKWLPSSRTRGC